MEIVDEELPTVEGLEITEEDAPGDPFADDPADGDDTSPAQGASVAAPAFDIDDSGRRTATITLTDGTRIQLIQDVYVDWRAGTSVGLVLKGFANRRLPNGQVPGNSYRLQVRHGLSLQTRKLGRTVPPIDFAPQSNGRDGLYVVTGNLNLGVFNTGWDGAQSNSVTQHYWGAWQISATGEPSDNPIDRIWSHFSIMLGNREHSTPAYAARRGGQ
jgi:hypothetical protein